MNDFESFWTHLKIILKENQITMKDLSLKLGYNGKTLNVKQSTGVLPTTNDVIKICQMFNVSSDFLFFGKEPVSEISKLNPEYRKIIETNIKMFLELQNGKTKE